jgi:GTP-binding protein HflX
VLDTLDRKPRERNIDGPRPRAVLVGIQLPASDDDALAQSLAELERLAETLGLQVIGRVTQRRPSLDSSTGIGGGKLRELATYTGGPGVVRKYAPPGTEREEPEELPDVLEPEARASVVLVDHDLSPRQSRNLELATGAEVLDRSMVVVSIFQRHARTREAKLQVEIARLTYMAPRLREAGAGQDRQRGGVGGKGVGETTLELNRREIRDRIAELRRELEVVTRTADTQRNRRGDQATVALVGYTNAGKSSLMRALTGDDVYVADQLFATLETTVRTLTPETRPKILVSDTVGFIKNLPHDLVASFRSTLQEARDANLLLHVVDASDPAFRDQIAVTERVLDELEAFSGTRLLVLNKADRLDGEGRASLELEFPDAVLMSARRPDDVHALHERIVRSFEDQMSEVEFVIPYRHQARVAMLHAQCRVLEETHDEHGTRIRVRAPRAILNALERSFGAE